MNSKLLSSILLWIVGNYSVAATNVSDLILPAENWMTTRSGKVRMCKSYKSISFQKNFSVFAINFSPKGFIILSEQKTYSPVIGYSFEDSVDYNAMPSQLIYMLKKRAEGQWSVTSEIKTKNEWQEFLNLSVNGKANSIKNVEETEPLLSTRWGQGKYYNVYCPQDESSTVGNGHVWTGCVATALAQLLKYFAHPDRGYGSNTYSTLNYGELSANFSEDVYNWRNLPDYLDSNSSPTEIKEVAQLLFHCGVAVNMNYSNKESSASNLLVLTSLKNYFGMSSFTEASSLVNISVDEWFEDIKNEIVSNRPIYYGVHDDSKDMGHAFICDAYDENNFIHCNWGWNGSYNGYYALADLTPSDYNFSSQHYIIKRIQPVKRIFNDLTFSGEVEINYSMELEPGANLTVEDGSKLFFNNELYILIKEGGIDCRGSEKDSIIFRNRKDSWSGLIIRNVSPQIQKAAFQYCRFANSNVMKRAPLNLSNNSGGSILLVGNFYTEIDNCYFTGNKGVYGGAIACINSTIDDSFLKISNSSFCNNFATNGAAIYSNDVNIFINNCSLVSNNASSSGIITISEGNKCKIYSCINSNNISSTSGIVNVTNVRSFFLGNNSYFGNTSLDHSIVSTSSCDSVFVINCGFFNSNSGISTIHESFDKYSFIINNSFMNSINGGSHEITLSEVDTTIMSNCLFSSNDSYSPGRIATGNGKYLNLSYNSFPWINKPAEFRGETKIIFNINNDPAIMYNNEGTYRLSDQSPCINRGNNDYYNFMNYDLAGNTRIFGNRIDIGAIENNNVINNPSFNVEPNDSVYFPAAINIEYETSLEILNIDNPNLSITLEGLDFPFHASVSDDADHINISINSNKIGRYKDTLNIVSNISVLSIPVVSDVKYNESISGVLDKDTVLVIGDLRVLDGDTLIIKKGVTMFFEGDYRLLINGTLIVEGDEEENVLFTTSADTIKWEGIVFYGSSSGSRIKGAKFESVSSNSDCIHINTSKHISLSDCTFDNLSTKNIIHALNSENITVKNSSFKNCNGQLCYFKDCTSPVVIGNYFYKGNSSGVWIWDGLGQFSVVSNRFYSVEKALWIVNGSDGVIVNNLFSDCNNSVYCAENSSLFINNTIDPLIDSLKSNSFSGTFIIKRSASPKLINCIFSDTDLHTKENDIYISIQNSSTVEFYNCCIDGGKARLYTDEKTYFDGIFSNTIITNPRFVPKSYLLAKNSPCIDNGTLISVDQYIPEYDLDGELRLYNNKIDIGAYEYNTPINPDSVISQNRYILKQNFPNPFYTGNNLSGNCTKIEFTVPVESYIRIILYNILGEEIMTLIDGYYHEGNYYVEVKGNKLNSGVFLYTMETDKFYTCKKMVLIK